MRMPSRSPLAARVLGLALVTAMLSLAGPVGPAHAAGCANEQPEPFPPSACDDVDPPETSLEPMSPAPNAAGWTKTDAVTFTFAAINTDPSDTDEMQLECKLEGPSQAHDWMACDSGTQQQYTGLADTPEGASYTFSVRAFDSVDRPWDFDDPTTPFTNEDEVADEDATPETVSWKQDTKDPIASLFKGPHDSQGTGWPIANAPKVTYLIVSDEDNVTYRCQLDGRDVGCHAGDNTFKGLRGGNHTFSLTVKDRAGNDDESPATKQFVSPYNLTSGRNWSKVKAKGFYAGDVMQTRRAGARIKFRAQNIREFRLLAPAGPDLGKVRVRVGTGYWKTYDLSRPDASKRHYYVVRDAASPLFSGRILVESLARGNTVRVDALVFPPG